MPALNARIDDQLASGRRSLRTLPTTSLLGPTGARLWADYLDPKPGFSGAIDFIHKLNIPLLFTVESDQGTVFEPCKLNWHPSYLAFEYESASLSLREHKFVTWNDCAVAVQTWENRGPDAIVIRLKTDPHILQNKDQGMMSGVYSAERYPFAIRTVLKLSDNRLYEGLELAPGQQARLVIAAAMGIAEQDDAAALERRAAAFLEQPAEDILPAHQAEYQSWFDQAPQFACNEPLITKTWHYRWFLMRHNLADPRVGQLQYPLFYEGRSHKMSKTPFAPHGWEFSKLIPLTAPMHLLEARWYPDRSYGDGIWKNMMASQDDDGLYRCLLVNETLHSYANFMGWGAYQYYLIHRDKEMVRQLLPSLKRQVDGESRLMGNAEDRLIIEYKHNRTGKEYQPSYWYFNDFPKNCKDPELVTPLKRVDRSIYHYLNCIGVMNLCLALGDPEAERFGEQADQIKSDVLSGMWDEESQFFYDLHYKDNRKAFVKNIVGFYPYWAGMTDDRHKNGLDYLFDERYFGTRNPFPSVAKDCPVFSAEGGWQGNFFKGRNGCVWNGPTWPYTNSVILDALAEESKRREHVYDKEFGHAFREYSMLHYAQRDLDKPYLVEHYDSMTGEPISDDVDYNHSYYIDLVIRHIAGLNVQEDGIVLDPVHVGLTHFELNNVKINDDAIRVTYNISASQDGNLEQGYRLYVNNELVLHSEQLQMMKYTFPRSSTKE
ncbi:MGH1-like glycoside hydrolase domain-containing protein [Paenibacillus sp. PAMC21692]|uniref:MGH1-like glycoside hydrolase domain-containing protein n=1 Tax=Paenibacillus sp. PAMC21692 TaxID=2762320 RepID=UPI0021C42DE2|nr:trehalase family glycosidase [Paenibacillus sp. PAMC21692]